MRYVEICVLFDFLQDFRDNPVLFSYGTTRYEIEQRSAGILSMVAKLTEKEELIYKEGVIYNTRKEVFFI